MKPWFTALLVVLALAVVGTLVMDVSDTLKSKPVPAPVVVVPTEYAGAQSVDEKIDELQRWRAEDRTLINQLLEKAHSHPVAKPKPDAPGGPYPAFRKKD